MAIRTYLPQCKPHVGGLLPLAWDLSDTVQPEKATRLPPSRPHSGSRILSVELNGNRNVEGLVDPDFGLRKVRSHRPIDRVRLERSTDPFRELGELETG